MSFLPTRDQEYLVKRGYAFDEIEDGGQKALVFRGIPLPVGRYDAPAVDVLVYLPPGFPDVGPDMFFTLPWIRLIPEGCLPKAADNSQIFQGNSWQRWSRHASDWRAGRDGIHAVMQRILNAIEVARP